MGKQKAKLTREQAIRKSADILLAHLERLSPQERDARRKTARQRLLKSLSEVRAKDEEDREILSSRAPSRDR
jgi:hypothetical protein